MRDAKNELKEQEGAYFNLKRFLKSAFHFCSLFFIKQRKGVDRPERVVAIVLSWKRVINIPYVIIGLRKQSYIDDIIIYHNHPSWLWVPGCKNIFSKENLGCIVRHEFAATLKGYDYFVFSDDDFMLSCDFGAEIIPAIRERGKESVLGLFGRNINQADMQQPYTKGDYITSRQTIKPVDIILGRFHIISKEGINEIAKSEFNTPILRSEDDIRANLTLQRKFLKPSYLIPTKHKVIELQAEHALERRKHHKSYRNQAVIQGMNIGWKTARPEN